MPWGATSFHSDLSTCRRPDLSTPGSVFKLYAGGLQCCSLFYVREGEGGTGLLHTYNVDMEDLPDPSFAGYNCDDHINERTKGIGVILQCLCPGLDFAAEILNSFDFDSTQLENVDCCVSIRGI